MRYPAIFEYADDGISVSFPDIPGCFTCGYSWAEAMHMAQEALSMTINSMIFYENKELPTPTRIEDDDRVYWVPLDADVVYKIMETKKEKAKQEVKVLNPVS